MRVKLALAAGLALLAIGLAVTLSGSPMVRAAHPNAMSALGVLAETDAGASACQGGEMLPSGTQAIRLTLKSVAGPVVSISVLSGQRLLTSGVTGSGWTGGAVTVPVKRVEHAASHVRVCFSLGRTTERVAIVGTPTRRSVAARGGEGLALPGRLEIDYLRRGRRSWWSLAETVARHMGLGRAPSGTWIALVAMAAMVAAALTASWVSLKELRWTK